MRVLVATDVAARGIDIEALPFVVNYDLPHNAEDYVHRIGRTGRAGASGEAISLVSESETRYLKDIERLIGNPIEAVIVPGFEPGAADVPAYQSRPPRPSERAADRPIERTGERTAERARERAPDRRPPHTKPAAARDALFDTPYVSGDAPRTGTSTTPVRPASKKPVAALFRSPAKPETAGQ